MSAYIKWLSVEKLASNCLIWIFHVKKYLFLLYLSHKFFNLIKFIIFSPPNMLHSVTPPRNFRTILYSVCLPPLREINWESSLSILTPPCMLFFILKTPVKTQFSDLQFIYNWLAVLMLLHWIPHHILPMSCSLRTRLINADAVTPLRGNFGVENHSA